MELSGFSWVRNAGSEQHDLEAAIHRNSNPMQYSPSVRDEDHHQSTVVQDFVHERLLISRIDAVQKQATAMILGMSFGVKVLCNRLGFLRVGLDAPRSLHE